MGILKLDIDSVHARSTFELLKIFLACPRPFFIRYSASRRGLHLAVPVCGEWDYRRYIYDDPMRVDLDTQRRLKGLPVKNLLWDNKNGKPAGHWKVMRTERDIEDFVNTIRPISLSYQE